MNTIIINEFFAPVEIDLIDTLLASYNLEKEKILMISDNFYNKDMDCLLSYFIKGNYPDSNLSLSYKLFDSEKALQVLTSKYWKKVISLTKVEELMPNNRRIEWFKDIEKNQTPEFNYSNVKDTMINLLSSRKKFFSERIDGIFQNLSGSHITNSPEGFNRRMILNGVMDNLYSLDSNKVGYINDLKIVICKLLNIYDIYYTSIHPILCNIINLNLFGVWHDIDGGAFKIKLFKKGTVHIEIPKEIAFSMNEILSYLYPTAIPEKYKKRVKENKEKKFELRNNLIKKETLNILFKLKTPPISRRQQDFGWTKNNNSLYLHDYHSYQIEVIKDFEQIMYFIGGVKKQKNKAIWFEFDYPVKDIISYLILKNEYPNFKDYQYYPTKNLLKNELRIIANIKEEDKCLEPSAGQGDLIENLNKNNITCIELSELNFKILNKKGFNVFNEDFIKWSDNNIDKKYDKILMNPPFSKNRAILHIRKAVKHLKEEGILVAIIPSSYKNKIICENYHHEYSNIYEDFFEETKVSVVIVKITRKA